MLWKLLAAAVAAVAVSAVAVSVATPGDTGGCGSHDSLPVSEGSCCSKAVPMCCADELSPESAATCPTAGRCEARDDALAACGGGATLVKTTAPKAALKIGCCSEE